MQESTKMIEDEVSPTTPGKRKQFTPPAKEERTAQRPVETAPSTEVPRVNIGAFCAIRKYRFGVQSRLMVFAMEQNGETKMNPDEAKTLAEWDALYTSAMNQK